MLSYISKFWNSFIEETSRIYKNFYQKIFETDINLQLTQSIAYDPDAEELY